MRDTITETFARNDDAAIPAFFAGRETGTRQAVIAFSSWSEYVELASRSGDDEDRHSRVKDVGSSPWSGTKTYRDAHTLAIYGWRDGTAQLRRMTANMSGSMNVIRQNMNLALTGGAVDVPTYLTGEPECMWSWQDTEERKAVRVIIDGAHASRVTPEEIMRRGAAVVAFVDAMESAGYSAEIQLRFSLSNFGGNNIITHAVALKRSDEPMDLESIAFAIAHPASLRRIGFGAFELMHPKITKAFSFKRHGSYGSVHRTKAEEVDAGDIILTGNHKFYSDDEAMQWARECVASYGVELQ